MSNILLEIKKVSKNFPGVRALDQVDLDLKKGEIHALCGENGAGKSTLMKIISGIHKADEGEILYHGEKIEFDNPKESSEAGINIVYQELNLVPHLTVAQNIFIHREPMKLGGLVIDEDKMREDAKKIISSLNVDIDPDIEVGQLTVSKQQMVEIAKALSFKSEVLIMDEPTSALTESEIDELFAVMKKLRKDGVGIIYISHRLEELKHIVDRVTVFRDGRYISTDVFEKIDLQDIVNKMVGRKLDNRFPKRKSVPSKKKILEVKNINCGKAVKDVSFDLYQGEILGFAGLMGAGRTELARAIFGADSKTSGEIILNGKKLSIKTPQDSVKHGIAYLSEDRKREGLALDMKLYENVTLVRLSDVTSLLGVIDNNLEKKVTRDYVESLSIKTPSEQQVTKNLSGGNQQKAVIAKWLFGDSKILIFDEPTRGIDVGAKHAIYMLLDELALQGIGVIMISSELPEILGLADRVAVMCNGEIASILEAKKSTQEDILNYAAGVKTK